jgi:probable rRNA maturation factor
MPIHFFREEVSDKISNQAKVKKWIISACKKEGFKMGEVNYIFCNDSYLLKINQDFLNHDNFTDIITFDYSEGKVISGDIFISLERIKDNSKKFSASFSKELHRVMIHGVLHLMGYSDKTAKQKGSMRKKEDEYLSLWEINVPRET